ncbi:MAG: hypothetical protein P0Y53_00180 [Candidatus Pseudobacter hemicellulosilyticus]|uniref:Uncharacterized protein n=1 Tax=Candidatus Pseudobacter hemicellulosilyticus TaxID=3121375 RepID=A0AAJ6BFQ2_9BACT|nr:MAG: hypothetical protein P0Y53_00180 [Pseudobacter sp.]
MTTNLFHRITGFTLLALLVLAGAGCRKTEFGNIDSPAFIRVFNCLERDVTLDNKDAPQPFLTMLIDPVMDKDGIPGSADITGDFLDTRDSWARPYPDAGNTSIYQKEYPGSAKVRAAPFLNGYDLSSWAQVTSGKRRIMFFARPLNETPFFSLDKNLRRTVLLDTTVDLQFNEVYTMHVLEKNYTTRKTGLYVRNETFVRQSLSDSLVYVNFYNLSSEGFFANSPDTKSSSRSFKITDTTNVFYTLHMIPTTNTFRDIPGFIQQPMGSMIRSHENKVTPYYSFPLFADTSSNKIYPGNTAQTFEFLKPGYTMGTSANPSSSQLPVGYYAGLHIGPYNNGAGGRHSMRVIADIRSGLIVTERSGIYNPRYFATVNTIEYINDRCFVTTIQRKFDPPIY